MSQPLDRSIPAGRRGDPHCRQAIQGCRGLADEWNIISAITPLLRIEKMVRCSVVSRAASAAFRLPLAFYGLPNRSGYDRI